MEEISLESLKVFREFDSHQALYKIEEKNIGLRAYVAIHRKGSKNVAFGATRLWKYSSDEEAIRDALRLSKTMTYKSAFVGLNYGGAKAVIVETPLLLQHRKAAFKQYSEFVNSLNGQFITGTDAGLQPSDLKVMVETGKYIVGLKVNPEHYTALGLLYAIEIGLEQIFHSPEITNRTFSILGLGKVGLAILNFLYPYADKIYVAEINKEQIEHAKKKYPNIIAQSPDELLKQKVDVFIPCAVGTIITKDNVHLLNCKAIIGGSNNQLEEDTLGGVLFQRDILYAPDFIVNAGGLISVVDEYKHGGMPDEMRIKESILSIRHSLSSIFEISKETNSPTTEIAAKIAEQFFES